MRNAVVILTALCVGNALVGCSKSSNPAPIQIKKPNPTEENQGGALSWTLKYESKCAEGIAAEDCVAQYGFSIQLPDGQYTVGPTQSGVTRSGTITVEEMGALKTALGDSLTASALNAESHAAIEEVENQDTLFFNQGTDTASILVKTEGTDLTFRTKDADGAKALLSTVRALAEKYYSIPFPDSCLDGAIALEALFAPLQACSADTDCAYVDTSFDLIDVAAASYIYTDECKVVRPMIVGNASAIRSNQEKLKTAYSEIANTCGDRIYRADCSLAGFEPKGAAPTCQQGVCRINPASNSFR